jgi:hypothetical protein
MGKKRITVSVVLAAIAVAAGLTGCSDDKSTSPSETGTGTLSVQLADAPGVFDKVNITFSEVAVNAQTDTTKSGWIVIKGEPQTFDLLTLSNGVTAALGQTELDPGKYGQIRLKISKAEVVVDSVAYPLDVPSGSTSGLKLGGGFTVEDGVTTELVVDFDAARSIHVMGKKGDYKLNPRLRLVAKATTGSITGTVTNYANLPIAYAIAGTDTVTAAIAKRDTGKFILGFLPAGTYTVAVADTLNKTFSKTGVTVTVGSASPLGDITLQ